MRNKALLLLAMVFTTALHAQEASLLNKDDLLIAFQLYNPSVLEKATKEEGYRTVLQQLVSSYTAVRNEQNELELIALVKNFDNSVLLQYTRQQYLNSRRLQDMTSISLENLNAQTKKDLTEIFTSIYKNTLEIKKIQIKQYRQIIKEIKKDNTLSVQQKQQEIAFLKDKISQVKQEMRLLKMNAKASISATANAYLTQLQNEYKRANAYESQATQATSPDIKSNPQKTAAQ